MNNDNDKVTIPLAYTIEWVEKGNKFIKIGAALLIILFMIAAMRGAVLGALPTDRHPLDFQSILISGIFLYVLWRSYGRTKTLVKSDSHEVPALVLDSNGMTCPLALLSDQEKIALENAGKNSVEIKWDNIKRWTASNNPNSANFCSPFSSLSYDWWILELKEDADILEKRIIGIKKDTLVASEQNIFDFAQRFLPFRVDPMRVTFDTLKKPLLVGIILVMFMVIYAHFKH